MISPIETSRQCSPTEEEWVLDLTIYGVGASCIRGFARSSRHFLVEGWRRFVVSSKTTQNGVDSARSK